MYGATAPFPVFENKRWWSDDWDAFSYGRDIDFSRPFLEQYAELAREVPRFALMNFNCENSDFCNFAMDSRNCYLVFGCVRNEDCFYGHIVWDSRNCLDCLYVYRCEWCSHSVDLVDCYDVHYSKEATSCRESYFLFDCAGCNNCFCCSGLRTRQYCLLNEQLTKEEYFRRIRALFPLSVSAAGLFAVRLEELQRRHPGYPQLFGSQYEDVTGNHIYSSQCLRYAFDAKACEQAKYLFTAHGVSNSYDISFTGGGAQFSVDSLTLSNAQEVIYSQVAFNSANVAYSEFCFSSQDIFGCIGLRQGKCCILNKRYSKEKYLDLRFRLVSHMQSNGEWGEFFPSELSPFPYNESIVNEYMPITEAEARRRGLRWETRPSYEAPPAGSSSVPERITEATDETLREVFYCQATHKPYKVIAAEIEFCRRMGLPLSPLCPDERHLRRMALRASRELAQVRCSNCDVELETAHVPPYAGKVFCAKCCEKQA